MTTVSRSNTPATLNRREFLFYLAGGAAALTTVGACAASLWFARPDTVRWGHEVVYNRSIFDERGIHESDLWIAPIREYRVWLMLEQDRLTALYGVCPFRDLSQLTNWVATNARFECPQCGSKFTVDGAYIEGGAERGMDRFPMRASWHKNGRYVSVESPDGSPMEVDINADDFELVLYPNNIILGEPNESARCRTETGVGRCLTTRHWIR